MSKTEPCTDRGLRDELRADLGETTGLIIECHGNTCVRVLSLVYYLVLSVPFGFCLGASVLFCFFVVFLLVWFLLFNVIQVS